jgi:hypothetical protein
MTDRKKPTYRVPHNAMRFVFVRSYYDIPLSGTCKVNDETMRFQFVFGKHGGSEGKYHVFRLSLAGKATALIRQKLFELCVGAHMSFNGRSRSKSFVSRHPKWLHAALMRVYFAPGKFKTATRRAITRAAAQIGKK